LKKLAAQTKDLETSTKSEKKELARINERIDTLVGRAAPIWVEIHTIKSQLIEKDTDAKEAREAEDEATQCSEILFECHRSIDKSFIMAMKEIYDFSDWKIIKENCNIGPQTEAILLVFYDMSCFFSQTELELFPGYKSPNHNVDGALTKMVEKCLQTKMVEKCLLIKTTNKVKTEIYYLGHFAMQALHRKKLPHKERQIPGIHHHSQREWTQI
jgi:hypothetical protein